MSFLQYEIHLTRQSDFRFLLTTSFKLILIIMTTRTPRPQPQHPGPEPVKPFTIVEISSLDADNQNCPICWEPFQEGDCAIRLDCSHVFGRKCIQTWVLSNNTCPQCRKPIFDESAEAEFDDMADQALVSPAEEWPNLRARLISLLESPSYNSEQEDVDRILMFIDKQTTADEAPNGIVRFVLALAGADPRILSNGTCMNLLKALEEQGPEAFEGWCTTEEFGATMKSLRQQLLGMN